MPPFTPRLIFGPGRLSELPECAASLGVKNILLVTDPGIVAAGHVARATTCLEAAGLAVTIYQGSHVNPTESDIEACRAFAQILQPDALIGLGGGSSMDTAKGCNFLLHNGGRMSDYRGYGLAHNAMLPFIAIPTTAGTGSECQSYAVISRDGSHEKMACGDPKALARIAIGDVATYDHEFELIHGSVGTARAFDNKVGAYVVGETLIRLAKDKDRKKLAAKVVAVATSQEEIGCRGATTAAHAVDPHIALAVDVGHATDHPDCDNRKYGETTLGGGPILCRGANINPKIFARLVAAAKKLKIPYQIEADPRPTGTDARAIQMGRGGVATGLVSIPLRYMHTPSEVVDLEDVERCVQLFVEFTKSLEKGDYAHW